MYKGEFWFWCSVVGGWMMCIVLVIGLVWAIIQNGS